MNELSGECNTCHIFICLHVFNKFISYYVQEQGRKRSISNAARPIKKRRYLIDGSQETSSQSMISNNPIDRISQILLRQTNPAIKSPPPLYLPVTHLDTKLMYDKHIEMLTVTRSPTFIHDDDQFSTIVKSFLTPRLNSLNSIESLRAMNQDKCIHEIQDDDSKSEVKEALDIYSLTTISLSQPGDKKRLSKLQCFLRQQIEFFEATIEDVNTYSRGRNKSVEVGQVGIRCIHCSVLPVKDRSKGSTYFPSTLAGIYQAAQNMYHYHFCTGCPTIAETYQSQFHDACSSRSCYGGGKDYWSESAERMGLVETMIGLKFKVHCTSTTDDLCHEVDQASLKQLELTSKDTTNIVTSEDRKFTTDYIFMLFSQMSPYNPAKQERGNEHPGLTCKHCQGCYENISFFRKKVSSLSKNENLAQIDRHLSLCRCCPDEVKVTLKKLKELHGYQMRRLKRGNKKIFFTKIMAHIYEQTPNVPKVIST